ncbi:hypothetical protein [Fusobacterium sp. SYSU M8D902]|uniref:hypothetical protein n=1 Tax=Fusobacterium sp. SYSU M8D902 TaxID=3159562 RepID=UPI0032E46A2D
MFKRYDLNEIQIKEILLNGEFLKKYENKKILFSITIEDVISNYLINHAKDKETIENNKEKIQNNFNIYLEQKIYDKIAKYYNSELEIFIKKLKNKGE